VWTRILDATATTGGGLSPDVGPFLQRTVNGPPDSPKVVDDDCPVGGLSEGTESSDGAALVTCDNFAE
jgi:hypothetical protein